MEQAILERLKLISALHTILTNLAGWTNTV